MSARRRGVAPGTSCRDTARSRSLRETMCFEKSRRAADGNQPIFSSIPAGIGRGRLSRHRNRSLLAVAHGREDPIGTFLSRASLATSAAATGVKRCAQAWKSVSRAAVSRRNHQCDAFIVSNPVEESPRPDPVSLRLRRGALQLANVRPEVGVVTQLPVDGSPQLADDLLLTSPRDRL